MTKREITKLDKIWRERIHARDNETCRICGKPGNNAHHIVGRRNRTLRWDLKNGILLCPLHHTFGRESAHQDPIWFSAELLKIDSQLEPYLFFTGRQILKQTYEDVMGELGCDI